MISSAVCKMQMMFSVSSRCKWIPGLPLAPVVMVMEAHSGREGPNTLGFPPPTHHPNLSLSSFPNLSAGHLPPNSHAVCLHTTASSSLCLLRRHITQKSRPQRPCHAPLLASSHHSGRVAAYPSTHWLSSWWGSGWQPRGIDED